MPSPYTQLPQLWPPIVDLNPIPRGKPCANRFWTVTRNANTHDCLVYVALGKCFCWPNEEPTCTSSFDSGLRVNNDDNERIGRGYLLRCRVSRCCNDEAKSTSGHYRSQFVLRFWSRHVCSGGPNDLFVRRVALNLETRPCYRHDGYRSWVLVGPRFPCMLCRGIRPLAFFQLGIFCGVYAAHAGLDSQFLAGGSYSRLGPSLDRCDARRAGRVLPA